MLVLTLLSHRPLFHLRCHSNIFLYPYCTILIVISVSYLDPFCPVASEAADLECERLSDGGKNLGTPPSSHIPPHRHPTLSSSTDPYKPILNHGLQEMRKGEHTPLLSFHLCHRQTTLTNNANRVFDNRNFRKLPHQTRSHLPRARSKRAPERSAEGMLCYPDQVLQRHRLDHPQWEDRRTGSQYVFAHTPSPPLASRLRTLYFVRG